MQVQNRKSPNRALADAVDISLVITVSEKDEKSIRIEIHAYNCIILRQNHQRKRY